MATDDQIEKIIEALGKLNASQADVLSSMLKKDKVSASVLERLLKGSGSAKELDVALKDLVKTLNLTKEQEDALRKGVAGSTDKFGTLKKSLGELEDQTGKTKKTWSKTMDETGKAFTKGVGDILKGGSSFKPSSMYAMFDPLVERIPLVGGALSGAIGFMVGYIEETYDSFRTLTGSGYQAGATLGDLQKAASITGLSLSEFKDFVVKNSQALSNFGNGVASGVDRFNTVFQPLLAPAGKYNTELKRLGYSTAEMQGVIGSFVELTTTTGEAQRLSNDQLTQAAIDTLRDVDTVARLTGKTREQIAKQLADTAKSTPSVERMFQLLGPEVAKKAGLAMEAMGNSPALKAGLLEAVTTGGKVIGPELSKIQALMPGLAGELREYGRILSEGGDVSQEQIQATIERAKVEAQQRGIASQAIAQALQLGAAQDGLADTILPLNEVIRYSVKNLKDMRKGVDGSAAAIIPFEQLISQISQLFRGTFLPTIEKSLTPAFRMFADLMEASKDKIADFAPTLQAAAEGLAARFSMLFDKDGRQALIDELSGYLKSLLASLVEVMSESLAGRSLGFTKQKADVLRAESNVSIANAERQRELTKAGANKPEIDRLQSNKAQLEKQLADAKSDSDRQRLTKEIADVDSRIEALNKIVSDTSKVSTDNDKKLEDARKQLKDAEARSSRDETVSTVAGTATGTAGMAAVAGLYTLAGGAAGTGIGLPVAALTALAAFGLSYYLGKGATQEALADDPKKSGMARGGIVNVPRSGQLVALHGKEAVVPLPDGRTIPVTLKDSNSYAGGAESVNNSELINQVTRLNEYMAKLVTINMDQQDILDRQLRIAKDMNPLS